MQDPIKSPKAAVILSERDPQALFSLGVVSRRICGCFGKAYDRTS